ncbi:MAG: c-type cytochrome [Gammaproteobacteria bacterium]|nr:c-type cytochrome [Gammaproteobacteria bacterium]NIN37700.1 c-type cytochrome [Gammaproteobacteria bacterium]NIO24404.1 c-type cytochrome [Gammaproteobacteria bacterium]NIO65007.1 c-type cytochrome [Gammaproteobacteria bacterium]NIP47913.1 cytochrome c [Gammaproteobacteria bacterium]
MRTRARAIAALAGLLTLIFVPAFAAEEPIEELGKQEFVRSCAACHGESGKGDGMLADMLVVAPPDLTSLRKRHGGKFPTSWVYRIIDGRNEIRPHGSREMPIWGDRYRAEALRELPLPLNVGADALVHGRILSLVFYIDFIQEE